METLKCVVSFCTLACRNYVRNLFYYLKFVSPF